MRSLKAADLFCGAGGTSKGLSLAAAKLNRRLDLIAINHWQTAIDTHSSNHVDALHLCESMDSVDPRKLVPGGRLNLLVASPECTHHSVARGGKPINDQSRASAWHILRWAEALYIDSILIENVKEFESWGPIGANGRPLKSKRGQTFQSFIDSLKSLGYNVDRRILNAANYGDPTTRERLFIQARRGGRKITWPEATHAKHGGSQGEIFGSKKPWRTAREIVDWSLPGQSIFTRKRELAPATLERIVSGLRKFGGAAAEPFIVVLRNHMGAKSLNDPLPTVSDPLRTVTTTSSDMGLVEPFVMSMEHGGKFIIPTNHGGKDSRTYPLDKPMPTVTTVDAWGLVEPFLVSYYGTQNTSPVSAPAPTVTTKDRFGLVEVDGLKFDIRFRMLQPRELARAQGFPDDYKFSGNREETVKQIGNAVPVGLAEALCSAILESA